MEKVSTNKLNKIKNSSFEILRIISMFLIILHHYSIYGTLNISTFQSNRSGTFMISALFEMGGKIGVIIFVLIGATFLCEKAFQFRRPIYLLVLSWFYSIVIFLILEYLKIGIPSHLTITNMLLPLPTPSGYWFVGSYTVMLFMMPALNLILNNFDEYKLIYILIFLLLMWSILSSLIDIFPEYDYTSAETGGNTGTYFLFVYLIAGYIRKYEKKWMKDLKITFSIFIISVFFDCLIVYLLCNQNEWGHLQTLLSLQSPFVLLTSVTMFLVFNSIKINSNKLVNYLAPSMFAVYLIHDNSFIRALLWSYINSKRYSGISYLLYGLSVSLIVILLCTGIDLLGRLVYEKPLTNISKKVGIFVDTIVRNNFLIPNDKKNDK